MYIISVVFLSMLVILLVTSLYLSGAVVHPKTHSPDETYRYELENGRIKEEEFSSLEKEEVYIESPYGYKIYGLFFPVKDSKKAVIICHGITWTLYGCVKYAGMFLKRGFNVLIYDHRYHGRTGDKNTTFGFYEKNDLKTVVDWLYNRLGEDCKIGTMGESLGAATVLQHSAIDPRLSFCIADCPYSDILKLFKIRMKNDFHFPAFPVLQLAVFFARLRTGARFSDISPVRDIEKCTCPVFFIHGENDMYIPKEMSIEMYKRKKGYKKLYIAPNSEHVESYWNNREEYDKLVGDFLMEIGLLT